MKLTKSQQERVNNFMRRLDIDPSSVINNGCAIKIHPTESKWHFLMKAEICWSIYQEGRPFWSEAFTRNKLRKFDVLDPLGDGVVEIERNPKEEKLDADKVVRI